MKAKKMNEAYFAKLVKEFNSVGEFIRARQEEKQAILDDYSSESKRFGAGKISKATLISSSKKVNKELQRLDNSIRDTIRKTGLISNQARKFVAAQSPKVIRVSVKGGGKKGSASKKKKSVKKKAGKAKSKKMAMPNKKAIMKKELAMDKKYTK